MLQYEVDNFSVLFISLTGIRIYILQQALLAHLTEAERYMYTREENLAYLQKICGGYLIPSLGKFGYNI